MLALFFSWCLFVYSSVYDSSVSAIVTPHLHLINWICCFIQTRNRGAFVWVLARFGLCMYVLWIITSISLRLYSANSKHSFQRSVCWCFYLYFIISFENVGGVFFRSHAFTEFRAQDCHTHIHSKWLSVSVPFFLLHTLFRSVLSTIVKLNNNIHLPK